MRKVELTMTEQVIYEIVKDFVDHREERNLLPIVGTTTP